MDTGLLWAIISGSVALVISLWTFYYQHLQGAKIEFDSEPILVEVLKKFEPPSGQEEQKLVNETRCTLVNKGHGIGVVKEIRVKNNNRLIDADLSDPEVPFAINGKSACLLKLYGLRIGERITIKHGDKCIESQPIK